MSTDSRGLVKHKAVKRTKGRRDLKDAFVQQAIADQRKIEELELVNFKLEQLNLSGVNGAEAKKTNTRSGRAYSLAGPAPSARPHPSSAAARSMVADKNSVEAFEALNIRLRELNLDPVKAPEPRKTSTRAGRAYTLGVQNAPAVTIRRGPTPAPIQPMVPAGEWPFMHGESRPRPESPPAQIRLTARQIAASLTFPDQMNPSVLTGPPPSVHARVANRLPPTTRPLAAPTMAPPVSRAGSNSSISRSGSVGGSSRPSSRGSSQTSTHRSGSKGSIGPRPTSRLGFYPKMERPRAKSLTTTELLRESLDIDPNHLSAIYRIKKAGIAKHKRARSLSQTLKPDDVLAEALGKRRMINQDGSVVKTAIADEEFSFLPTYGTPSRAIRGSFPLISKPAIPGAPVPLELRQARPTVPTVPNSITHFENTIGLIEEVQDVGFLLALIGIPDAKEQATIIGPLTNLFRDDRMIGKGPRKLDGVRSKIVAQVKKNVFISRDFEEKISLKEKNLVKAVQIKWCYYILWCAALLIRDQFVGV